MAVEPRRDWQGPGMEATVAIAERVQPLLNRACDLAPRTTISVFGRNLLAFRVCGVIGYALAVALGGGLAWRDDRSLAVLGLLALAAALTFVALAFATKVIAGEERLVYYQHELAIFAVAALLLWAIGRPVLAYLDLTALGVGAFLACGRVGCFLVGCCHGRPGRWGVRYRAEHVAIGFPGALVGARLLPVQLIEAGWAAAAVALGTGQVLSDAPAGSAWCAYVVLYDLGRFVLEFYRGDPERPYRLGFSSAQWLSLVLTALVVGGGAAGVLPRAGWHATTLAVLLALMAAAILTRRRHGVGFALAQARHQFEIAEIVNWGCGAPPHETAPGQQPRLGQTSLGVRISTGVWDGDQGTMHYGISLADRVLSAEQADAIAGIILSLKHPGTTSRLLQGHAGIYHLLVSEPHCRGAVGARHGGHGGLTLGH